MSIVKSVVTERHGDGYFHEVDVDEEDVDDFPDDDESRLRVEHLETPLRSALVLILVNLSLLRKRS